MSSQGAMLSACQLPIVPILTTAIVEVHVEMLQVRQCGKASANGRHIDDATAVFEIHVEMLQVCQCGEAMANGRHIDDATAIYEPM